jgi:nucleoside-diphosphate-sugar epimerase
MRILIIGGTGIISTGITRLLIARGDDVVLNNRGLRPSLVEGKYTTITDDAGLLHAHRSPNRLGSWRGYG